MAGRSVVAVGIFRGPVYGRGLVRRMGWLILVMGGGFRPGSRGGPEEMSFDRGIVVGRCVRRRKRGRRRCGGRSVHGLPLQSFVFDGGQSVADVPLGIEVQIESSATYKTIEELGSFR